MCQFYLGNNGLLSPSSEIIIVNETGKTKLFENTVEAMCRIHGSNLLDILVSENEISLNNNELFLNRILTGNPHADATRLIGSIAEVLVANYCKKHVELNRYLGMCARYSSITHQVLDNYIPIVTGSYQTKLNYGLYYNPSDTQRDIVWIRKDDHNSQLNCVRPKPSAQSSKPAGLQIKVSHDYRYVLSSIKGNHYPVLYFDLNNDWSYLYRSLSDIKNSAGFSIAYFLVAHNDITNYIKEELKSYFNIIVKIFNNEMSLKQLIDIAKNDGKNEIIKGLNLANLDGRDKISIG